MLCPEVWKFSTNRTKLSHQFGNYDIKAIKNLDKYIQSYPFNKMISIILPGCETVPTSVEQLIDACDYYVIRNLKLSDLVARDFVETFIKRGNLTGISTHAEQINDSENVFAINPDGHLILSINKDLYTILGLEGRPARYPHRNQERFEIIIDLKCKDFQDHTKLYNRLQNLLLISKINLFDFQLSWMPNDKTTCASSIAKFFNDRGYKVEQHGIQMRSISTKSLKIPGRIFNQRQIGSDLANEITEYFAMAMLECKNNKIQELSSYGQINSLSLDDEDSSCAEILHFKGLLTSDLIAKLLRETADYESAILSVNHYDKLPLMLSKGYTIGLFNNINFYVFFKN